MKTIQWRMIAQAAVSVSLFSWFCRWSCHVVPQNINVHWSTGRWWEKQYDIVGEDDSTVFVSFCDSVLNRAKECWKKMVLRNAGEMCRLDKCIMNSVDVDALRSVTKNHSTYRRV